MNDVKAADKAIFLEALDCNRAEELNRFLDRACGSDVALRTRVEELLRAHREAGAFLGGAATHDQPIAERPGTVIGSYKLLEQIGEGGFGVVFMAEQQQPVRRKVAVKVLKPGMDTRQVVARFEAERQALALMDHPNIARVLEAGETASGRPFFAMELVRGVPITDYCDKNNLATRERLDLFLTVCQAVQHAHQKGIIHRDLKPSNILVTLHDGVPVAKVIDFGIAKALGQQLTDKTLYTGFAQLVGTPLYMSPEQAEMSGLDVDTRSDIYSLAVLLYELLTGTTPFDKERLTKAGYDEMRRIIRDEEPIRPSTRISTMGQAATVVSARRQSDPRGLSQLFRGELDWIVMKALEKDRNRRYETAATFAADVQRFLRDEPVSACPPSSWYRLKKTARRHRWTLALGGVVAAALVVIAAGSLIAALLLNRALKESEGNRIRAEGAEETAKDAERTAVTAERAATERLLNSLVDQARASRLSRRIGQRFKTLEALTEAVKIARDLNALPEHALELRNEAIASLGLADLRVAKEWDGWPTGSMTVGFDSSLERYARVDRQGVVHIHRVSDGSAIWRLEGFGPGDFGGGETYPHFSPDGRFLLLTRGREVKRVKLWTFAGPEPAVIPLEPAACAGAALSPDSREIALAQADGSIRLHDLPSGRERKRLKGAPNPPWLAYHPQARQLASSHAAGVQIIDLETGNVLADLPELAGGHYIAWHPNGKTLAVAFNDRTIHLWDVVTCKPSIRLEGRDNAGITFSFNHAGDLLAGTGWDRILHLWDTRTGRELFSTQVSGTPFLRFSPDDRLLAAGWDPDGNRLRLWQVARPLSWRPLVLEPRQDGVGLAGYCSISPQDALLAVGTNRGVGLWDLGSGAQLAFLDIGGWAGCLFESSGALLTWGPAGVMCWPIQRNPDVARLMRIGPPEKLPLPATTASVVLSRDGRVLAVAGSRFTGSRGVVWHRDLPGPPLQLPFHFDPRYIDISPDGRWVATGSYWGTNVKVSDAMTAKFIQELPADQTARVQFSPDGRWLAAGGGCRLWQVGSWRPGPHIGGFGYCLVFSPNGRLLAVETGYGVVRLVDPDTGREYARLEDPNQGRAYASSFSPEGAQLAIVNADSSYIQVWDLRVIRRQMAELGLDWELPPYPPAAEREDKARLRLEVNLGEVVSRARALAKNTEAWRLATSVEAKARDPHRAIELAKEAIQLAPKEGLYWNTLGVAHYRAGHWDDCIRAMEKSMQLTSGRLERFDTFFLAMAHWQRNDKEQARKLYDQAVAWMEKYKAELQRQHTEELRRFRAEAAALLEDKGMK
jgi:serine/threonine protein kinase/WD40 repeat protein